MRGERAAAPPALQAPVAAVENNALNAQKDAGFLAKPEDLTEAISSCGPAVPSTTLLAG